MFTAEQIKTAHSKVKSGADFPKYIQDIKRLGVTSFETWVIEGRNRLRYILQALCRNRD
ncbi:MAG: DUF1398 family protein [Ginsengibacter sp.]